MKYRRLGRTGTQVAEIALGTMQFLWTASREDSLAVLDRYVELGGNLLDTANVYTRQGGGVGSVETLLGEWLHSRGNRDEIILATKVRAVTAAGPNNQGLGRVHIMRAVEESLRRLRTDHIDLYQAHWIDVDTPIEETLHAFDDLVRQGKVRYVGASNFSSPWRLAEALLVSRYEGLASFVTYQPHYNLLYREELERWLLPLIQKYEVGVLAWSPLEGGLLTGKYRHDEPAPPTLRADSVMPRLTESADAIIETVRTIGEEGGLTPAQVSLTWLLAKEWITAPIVGANTVAQLDELMVVSELRLSDTDLGRLDEITEWPRPGWWLTGQ